MEKLRTLFADRHGDIRLPWRLAIAIGMLGITITAALFAAAAAGWTGPMGIGTATLAGALLSSLLLTRLLNHKPITAIGLGLRPSPLPELLAGGMLGAAAIGGISAIFWISGHVTFSPAETAPGEILRVAAYAFLSVTLGAAAEEVVFRGYLFQTLTGALTLLPASVVLSVLFAAAHSWNPGMTLLAASNIALAGLLFCLAYAKTGRLWLPLGLHTGWNFAQLTLAGFPASGLRDPERMITLVTVTGPAWWTGGEFGPEGGLAATAALLALGWGVLKIRRFGRPPGVVTLESLEDLIDSSKN